MRTLPAHLVFLALATTTPVVAQGEGFGLEQVDALQRATVAVPSGSYRPLLVTADPEVGVAGFSIDAVPVTRHDYLRFVTDHPEWRRSAAPPLFVGQDYLAGWAGDLAPDGELDRPVTEVSWFAARAYAEWKGLRLPTTDEWEYAASASETRPDGRSDPAYTRRLLAWYGRRMPDPMPAVGSTPPNYWGAHDLHGLVWEWVGDFTSALITTDSRSNRDANSRSFCAAGAVGASDFEDYAAFLRFGFRGGLDAHYTVPNLGFRLALDAPPL